MASNTDRRKMWSEESMVAATNSVLHDNKGVREASRLYNVPFETLRRRVKGIVQNGCRPGPATILTEEEEDHLARNGLWLESRDCHASGFYNCQQSPTKTSF